jgi:hypothetical protein
MPSHNAILACRESLVRIHLRRFRQLLTRHAALLAALGSTKLPSTDNLFPWSSPLSRQRATNNCSKSFYSWKTLVAILRERGMMRDVLIESDADKLAPPQMHAQLLDQLALAGDAIEIADQ